MSQGVDLRGEVNNWSRSESESERAFSHVSQTRCQMIYLWAGRSSSKGEWRSELVLCTCTWMTCE